MTCEVHNKEINSQCAELLVRSLYHSWFVRTLRTFKTERTLRTKKSKAHFSFQR